MAEPPILTDGVVTLDALRPDDDAAMVAADDEAIRRAWGRAEPLTLDTAERWIATADDSWKSSGTLRRWAVRSVAERRLSGSVALNLRGTGALVEVWIAPADRCAHVGRDAVALACGYGFTTLGLQWIDAEIKPDNRASQRLVTSLGFQPFEERGASDGSMIHAYRLFRSNDAPSS